MHQKKLLNLVFTYAIKLFLFAFIIAMFVIGSFNLTNVAAFIYLFIISLLYGLTLPGSLSVWGLQEVFHFSVKTELGHLIMASIVLVISLIPWLILEILIEANKKKWIIFVRIFILMYTVCGAVYVVGYFLKEDYIRKNMPF